MTIIFGHNWNHNNHAAFFPHIPVYDGYMRTFLFGARISALNIEEV